MAKLKWKVIHDCDDDEGNATCWSTEINHPRYGKYAWISDNGTFDVEVEQSGGYVTKAKCRTLTSAKRWVATYLLQKIK